MEENYRQLAQKAAQEKAEVLREGGYAVTPHVLYREILPEIKEKYDARTAQACVILYGYLQAYVNGESGGERYMWAFPNQTQIECDTGIKRNRYTRLTEILRAEGLMETKKEYHAGREKLFYLPLYRRKGSG
ncbi:hypothetical protein [Thalassobacillus sp. CUG 92003]|uniref:hypothetical protein n=1 Tax=Thalassobacillus sp. CUG 92003 TaxID=2736641 RepID=UPI0015E6EEA7|nr:hypothetical protein [Thalassobacillus sp. CUG 92003]